MNEEQIVASLASKVPREPLPQRPDEPSKVVQEVVKQAETVAKPNEYPNDLAAMKLMDFFELGPESRKDRQTLDKLNFIYAWASEDIKSDDSVDVMTKIRDLEQRLGLTLRVKEKLDSIYRWIKLDKQRRQVEKELALI